MGINCSQAVEQLIFFNHVNCAVIYFNRVLIAVFMHSLFMSTMLLPL